MIDLRVDREQAARNADWLRERGVILPTFEEQAHPELIPEPIKDRLREVGLWEVNPLNLYRITWKNEPRDKGGLYGPVNWLALPPALTGVRAPIWALVGKWFPTGAHKVGATYGCLVPRLVTGQFDPLRHKAVWPSTGNYCRGGAFNSALIGCQSIAILPEEMSRERFDWLRNLAGEVITTPGGESNVKEIYDKCRELRSQRPEAVIFNQFDEFGNYLWHYHVTGQAMEEVLRDNLGPDRRLAALVSATGSGGTIACGDFLKELHPGCKITAAEAWQCPTLLLGGFGAHRIEGIGDKHVPWIHNVRNTDLVAAVDDEACLALIRLFNEPAGRDFLAGQGLSPTELDSLPLVGISGAANILAAIKTARYFELNERDVVLTVLTDSMDLYASRIEEMRRSRGAYGREEAVRDFHVHLLGQGIDHLAELNHYDRKRIHNLKYFTWIEQQGRASAELEAQWRDYPDYWLGVRAQVGRIDELIREFNQRTGLLAGLN